MLLASPLSVVLRTPNALSVTLLCVTDEAAAPTRRTPAPRRRFWLFSAWLPNANGSLFGVGAKTLPIGAFAPCTRFEEIVVPVTWIEAPAVTRTPSWPKSGPTYSGNGGRTPVAPLPDGWQSPTISLPTSGSVWPPAVKSL